MKTTFLFLCLFIGYYCYSQSMAQDIRGIISDDLSGQGLDSIKVLAISNHLRRYASGF